MTLQVVIRFFPESLSFTSVPSLYDNRRSSLVIAFLQLNQILANRVIWSTQAAVKVPWSILIDRSVAKIQGSVRQPAPNLTTYIKKVFTQFQSEQLRNYDMNNQL